MSLPRNTKRPGQGEKDRVSRRGNGEENAKAEIGGGCKTTLYGLGKKGWSAPTAMIVPRGKSVTTSRNTLSNEGKGWAMGLSGSIFEPNAQAVWPQLSQRVGASGGRGTKASAFKGILPSRGGEEPSAS